MTAERDAYARYRLERARATLTEAKTLLEAGLLHGTVNRLYYACFYAVSGLLYTEGKSSSKHAGVMSFFDLEWVRPRRIRAEFGRFYHDIFEDRQEADYGEAAHFETDQVRAWFDQATSFVDEVSKLVECQIAKSSPSG